MRSRRSGTVASASATVFAIAAARVTVILNTEGHHVALSLAALPIQPGFETFHYEDRFSFLIQRRFAHGHSIELTRWHVDVCARIAPDLTRMDSVFRQRNLVTICAENLSIAFPVALGLNMRLPIGHPQRG